MSTVDLRKYKKNPPIKLPTIQWLREHFTSLNEANARQYAFSENPRAAEVRVFLEMVNARIAMDLEISDPIYADGMTLFYEVGILTDKQAESLLQLGKHDPTNHLT